MRTPFLLLAFLWSAALAPATGVADPPPGVPGALPQLGKWMYNSRLRPADWLGAPHLGKPLYEPINLVIADGISASGEEALARVSRAVREAGFPSRWGHSTGYLAEIEGGFFPQIKSGQASAFSDAPWHKPNNHGRIFGPVYFDGKYWFTAAFSRQRLSPLKKVRHRFVSFGEARDRFALNLHSRTHYRITGFLDLSNVLTEEDEAGTGDHDGLATLLELRAEGDQT